MKQTTGFIRQEERKMKFLLLKHLNKFHDEACVTYNTMIIIACKCSIHNQTL